MILAFTKFFWGDISSDELKKFGNLSLIFFLIIGAYWILKPLKDTFFLRTVGKIYLPHVKMLSAFCMILLVMIYAKLVDWFNKQTLTYIICTFYSLTFAIITYCIAHKTLGLANTATDKFRFIGWITYITIESFGTLVVALFWSFVASNFDSQTAKRGYPLIVFGAQFGSLSGALLTTQVSRFGITTLMIVTCLAIIIVPFGIKNFSKNYLSNEQLQSQHSIQPTGPLEGLRLLFAKSYLMGILAVSTLFEVINILLEIQMMRLADASFHRPEEILAFLGYFGLAVNFFAFLFALFGTSFFMRKLGLRKSLTFFPILVGLVIMYAWKFHHLWTLFGSLVVTKGLAYTLNNPCKEIMYIPTSNDIKFKTKSWIDVFGARSAKGFGGFIATFFPIASELIVYGSLFSLVITGIWIPTAFYVSRTHKHLVDNNIIIE